MEIIENENKLISYLKKVTHLMRFMNNLIAKSPLNDIAPLNYIQLYIKLIDVCCDNVILWLDCSTYMQFINCQTINDEEDELIMSLLNSTFELKQDEILKFFIEKLEEVENIVLNYRSGEIHRFNIINLAKLNQIFITFYEQILSIEPKTLYHIKLIDKMEKLKSYTGVITSSIFALE